MIRMRTDFFAESLVMGTSMVVLMPQAAAGIGMEGADGAGGAGGPGGSDAAGGADADGVPVLYLLPGLSDDCTIWGRRTAIDRKSTRLNSSHVASSYAVFCSKKQRHQKGGCRW